MATKATNIKTRREGSDHVTESSFADGGEIKVKTTATQRTTTFVALKNSYEGVELDGRQTRKLFNTLKKHYESTEKT